MNSASCAHGSTAYRRGLTALCCVRSHIQIAFLSFVLSGIHTHTTQAVDLNHVFTIPPARCYPWMVQCRIMNDYDPNFIPQKSFAVVGQKIIVRNAENKILVLQRSAKSGSGGKWSLPGGVLERGEDPKTGIQREVMEETGITVHDVRPFHLFSVIDSDNDSVVMIGYSCRANTDSVKLNWEHDASQWVSVNEALLLNLSDHARIFIHRFQEISHQPSLTV